MLIPQKGKLVLVPPYVESVLFLQCSEGVKE